MKKKIVVEVKDIRKNYYLGPITLKVLQGISTTFPEGSFTSIMGPSGSGKSTLLNLLGCLDRPSDGTYFLDNIDVSTMDDDALSDIRNTKIGFIFQSFNLISNLSVLENIEVPLFYQHMGKRESRERAEKLAESVGLGHRFHHYPNELSGGECQRVAIARSLANNPAIILADEPTGNLDSKTGTEILNLIDSLHQDGKTIIMVTHDPDTAARSERIIYMKDGMVENIEEKSS